MLIRGLADVRGGHRRNRIPKETCLACPARRIEGQGPRCLNRTSVYSRRKFGGVVTRLVGKPLGKLPKRLQQRPLGRGSGLVTEIAFFGQVREGGTRIAPN